MDEEVKELLLGLEFGETQRYGNLSVFPVFSASDQGPEYLTLQEALAAGQLSVKEVSEGGSVPNLKVTNASEIPVLLLDGEELAGARQNRVVNTTILLREKCETIIPVSCTEQGRWSYSSREFSVSDNVLPRHIRSRKTASVNANLRAERSYRSDQGEIWQSIDVLQQSAAVSSSTGAMRDVYEGRKRDLDGYMDAFRLVPRQRGLFVFMGREPAGFDYVSRESAYALLHSKLTRSYAMDAIVDRDRDEGAPSVEAVRSFIDRAALAELVAYESVGHGTDFRAESAGVVGSVLVHRHAVIHAAFFKAPEAEAPGRMSGFNRRRTYRTHGRPVE
jgi:hypothetical protein